VALCASAQYILTILFLLSLGVAAWLFLHALPQNATADVQPTPKEEVLVAAGPLAAGTLLRSEDVVWRPAAGVVEPGTVVRPLAAVHTERDEQARNEVSGAALNVDLARGEPIRRSLIVKPGDREFLQVVLTSGARAIAIPISSVGAGTGLLNPGDRVDVVLTQNFNSEGLARRSVSETIAQNLRMPVPEKYIDWEDVDPVETSIASIKLRVPHGGLAELHPADLATIIDQLAPRDRAGVLASLDDEAVADAMEEMEPDTQVEVLEDLEPARAADILEEMSPDDAADLVADLSESARDEILALMEREEAAEVEQLLGYPEDTAGGIMTTEFVSIPAHLDAAATIDRLRELEPDAETIYYVYVTDDDGRLVGVLSLRDLIVAPPHTPISEVMIREPVAVGVLADQDEVAEVVAHYNLLAVPVVDDEGRLAGIVTVDDAIDTVLPTAWKKRLPRLFAR